MLSIKFLRENVNQFYEKNNNHKFDSGFNIPFPESIVIKAHTYGTLVGLGIACQSKDIHGYFLMPRSSICKTPLRQSNSIGLIDYEYRGEIKVAIDNISNEDYIINEGTCLFQIIFPSLNKFEINFIEELNETERGSGGFGSTNK